MPPAPPRRLRKYPPRAHRVTSPHPPEGRVSRAAPRGRAEFLPHRGCLGPFPGPDSWPRAEGHGRQASAGGASRCRPGNAGALPQGAEGRPALGQPSEPWALRTRPAADRVPTGLATAPGFLKFIYLNDLRGHQHDREGFAGTPAPRRRSLPRAGGDGARRGARRGPRVRSSAPAFWLPHPLNRSLSTVCISKLTRPFPTLETAAVPKPRFRERRGSETGCATGSQKSEPRFSPTAPVSLLNQG